MESVIRLKQKVNSDKIILTNPEFKKLIGKEVEILILIKGEIESDLVPPRALKNSQHLAGSAVLDQEAMQQMLENRFK
jgi:hypothetical protein